MKAQPLPSRAGFTLIEAALATCIVSIGFVSMLTLIGTGTRANSQAAQITTAIQLADTVRDLSLSLAFADPQTPNHFGPETGETLATFDDTDDLDGATLSPPADARRQRMTDLSGWSQHITVEPVNIDSLSGPSPSTRSGINRITVDVRFNGTSIHRQSWLISASGGI